MMWLIKMMEKRNTYSAELWNIVTSIIIQIFNFVLLFQINLSVTFTEAIYFSLSF